MLFIEAVANPLIDLIDALANPFLDLRLAGPETKG